MLLTNEEIKQAVIDECNVNIEVEDTDKAVAKAQLKKVAEWVIEQNDFDGEEDNSPGAYYIINKKLWQALLEEAK